MRSSAAIVVFLCCSLAVASTAATRPVETVQVDTAAAHRLRTLRPLEALGSTVDKEPAGTIPRLYSRDNVRAMLGAGLGWLSYRLFTELSVQDWHWNPAGSFSAGREGYWTSSSSTVSAPVVDSYGYRLPHRGSTTDQGNNEDYSRIDDGDRRTYWKSDPYLAQRYTGDPDAAHPQWVIVDLGTPQLVDAVRIDWAKPFATRYVVQWWSGADAMSDPARGQWRTFASAMQVHGTGGRVTLRLAPTAVRMRFLRILMTASSHACDAHGANDPRNCEGYAIAELGVGTFDRAAVFHDRMLHARCGGEKPGVQRCGMRQTATYASSTDPYHTTSARVRNQEQPGLDLIARGGLTRGLPATYPVPMLYSTPANAVAEVRYLRARGYPIAQIELGEEPDGQYAEPEDYAALYVQWARAIHAVAPRIPLGGPVFSGVNADLPAFADAHGNVSWLNRFLRYLRTHGALDQLAFMSYEHYPFDGCEHGRKLQDDLLREPGLAASMPRIWRADGLPGDVPMEVTEANFSAVNFSQTPMQIEGALWLADYMASSLASGVDRVVYYQDEPVPLSQNKQCPADWGNLTLFAADRQARIRARTAQFYAARMLTGEWLERGLRVHELYPSKTNVLRGALPLITSYAAKRPDGRWSVLLVNKDDRDHALTVRFTGDGSATPRAFSGDVVVVTFGPAQYVWRARGARSVPDPDKPPRTTTLHGGAGTRYVVPARSLTVLRGMVAP